MAKDSAIYGASNAVNAAIGALGFLLLTRAIAPAEYGTLALVVSLSGIFITLGTLSISNGMYYYFFAAEKEEIGSGNRILSSGFAVGAASALALALLVGLFLGPVTGFALIAPSLLLPAILFSYLEAVSGILQDIRRLRFEPIKFTVVSFTRSSLAVGLGLSMVYFLGAGPAGYLWGAVLGSALACFLGFYFARRDLNSKPEREPARAATAYSWPTALQGLSTWVAATYGLWVLAIFRGSEIVGQYAIGARFSSLVLLVVASVLMAWWPSLLRHWNEEGEVQSIVSRFSVYWSAGLGLLVLVSIPVANVVTRVAIPSEYWPVLEVLPVLLLGAGVFGVQGIANIGLLLVRKTRALAVVSWIVTLFGVAICLLLIEQIGWWAPALTYLGIQIGVAAGYRVWGQLVFPIGLPSPYLVSLWFVTFIGVAFCSLEIEVDASSPSTPISTFVGSFGPAAILLAITLIYRKRASKSEDSVH